MGENWEKTQFFNGSFFDSTHFSAENRQTTKNSGKIPNISQILPKKNLVGIAQKLTQIIQKVDPLLLGQKEGRVFQGNFQCSILVADFKFHSKYTEKVKENFFF